MPFNSHQKFLREYYHLLNNIEAQSGGQMTVDASHVECDDNWSKFFIQVVPSDGLYQGASCLFRVEVPASYPLQPPRVCCHTKLYHPNIGYRNGRVCVSLLDQDWHQAVGLEGCVMAILFLFYHPNLEDPLPSSPVNPGETWEDFSKNAYLSLRGHSINKYKFDNLVVRDVSQLEEMDCS